MSDYGMKYTDPVILSSQEQKSLSEIKWLLTFVLTTVWTLYKKDYEITGMKHQILWSHNLIISKILKTFSFISKIRWILGWPVYLLVINMFWGKNW